ncbi:hypothetical protein [Verrucomicrobium sp. BvORR034]|uniref:hypothetical protein n=1 Tax=Verrucomicrobium sp. BvORR034 TaxID=1396418 RepID=UPI000679E746|nr:hypothetical protein [Verrucomicrobium sp. BvORR034]
MPSASDSFPRTPPVGTPSFVIDPEEKGRNWIEFVILMVFWLVWTGATVFITMFVLAGGPWFIWLWVVLFSVAGYGMTLHLWRSVWPQEIFATPEGIWLRGGSVSRTRFKFLPAHELDHLRLGTDWNRDDQIPGLCFVLHRRRRSRVVPRDVPVCPFIRTDDLRDLMPDLLAYLWGQGLLLPGVFYSPKGLYEGAVMPEDWLGQPEVSDGGLEELYSVDAAVQLKGTPALTA